jgi:hypothetical protein
VFDYPSISEICQYLAAEGFGTAGSAASTFQPPEVASERPQADGFRGPQGLESPAQRQQPGRQALAVHDVHAALRRRVPVLPVLRDGLGPADPGLTHVLPLDPERSAIEQVGRCYGAVLSIIHLSGQMIYDIPDVYRYNFATPE